MPPHKLAITNNLSNAAPLIEYALPNIVVIGLLKTKVKIAAGINRR